ncbi:MAG: asparagine synthase [Gammaproteobacteria bacterium]|nr:asparagine synthase [Gammaproteobacteria bacterium]
MHTPIISDTPAAETFFHVFRCGERFIAEGLASASLGYRIEQPGRAAPEGVYAAWEWDGEEVRATNCRYGMYPLFYYATPHEFCMSPSLATLLQRGAPREFDHAALAVFLRLGFFLREDTAFRAIRQLPPNAVLRWRNGRIELTSSLVQGKLQPLSRAAAVEGYSSLFRAAIQRRLPQGNEFVVPISGGRDSRHILFELLETGRQPKFCITARHFPPRPNPDLEVARNLCAALNVRHVVLGLPVSRVQAELRKNLETHFCSEEHAWALAMADRLKGEARVLYDGIAGDILSAGLYQSEEKLRLYYADMQGLALSLLKSRTGEAVLQRLLTPAFYRSVDHDLAVARLTEELERHADSPNPVRSFYFWSRTRRAVALMPFGILKDFQVHTPYLDHDLYDFLASLPPEIVLDHQLHTETIQTAYPRHQAIPYEQKEAGSVQDRSYFRRLSRELAGVMLRHGASGLVRNSFVLPRVAACAIDGNARWTWWGPTRTLILLQLEEWTRKERQ